MIFNNIASYLENGRVEKSVILKRFLFGLRQGVTRGKKIAKMCYGYIRQSSLYFSRQTPYRLYRLKHEDSPTYFGYYDKSPFSYDNTKILAAVMVSHKDWLEDARKFPLKLGYFDWSEIISGKSIFHQFGSSSTWSWQQGCMLQWFPEDGNRLVIYNELVNGQFGAVVQNVYDGHIVRNYEMPIYSVDPSGKKAVSVNFSRLERLRPGYGYCNMTDGLDVDFCPEDDGIWLINLETGTHQLLLNLRQIASLNPQASMVGAVHYVNHVLFDPDGRSLAFLHLWQPRPEEYGRRRNRLVMYDLETSTVSILDDLAIVTHFCWLSTHEIVAFRYPNQGVPGYYTYMLDSNHKWVCSSLKSIRVLRDGHPFVSPKGNLLVTDTYPNRFGDQCLFLYSLSNNKTLEIGRFFSPFRFRGSMRCDLHPRFDRTGRLICFDSVHEGNRSMYVLDLGMDGVGDTTNE